MTLRAIRLILVVALVAAAMPSGTAVAQQATQGQQAGQAPQAPQGAVPVRLKIVVDRSEGDKPVTSIPFEVVVRANTNSSTSLNHGRSVPVQQSYMLPLAAGGVSMVPQVSIVYQSIGSNLSITSVRLADKTLTFDMMIDVSLVDSPGNASTAQNPTFRKFSMQLAVTAKLGETAVVAMSSDKTTNETAKVSVLADLVR